MLIRVHELAGNLLNINAKLQMASRVMYKNINNQIVGASPQKFCLTDVRESIFYSTLLLRIVFLFKDIKLIIIS